MVYIVLKCLTGFRLFIITGIDRVE